MPSRSEPAASAEPKDRFTGAGKTAALSRTAFARLQGVSKGTVSTWEARGLPVRDGLIDPEAGATWVAAHVELSGPPRRGPVPDTLLARLRSRKIKSENDLLDLALAAKRGALIDRAEALRALADFSTLQREAWLGWVARTVPELAAAARAEPGPIFAALDRAVRAQLTELARMPLPELSSGMHSSHKTEHKERQEDPSDENEYQLYKASSK